MLSANDIFYKNFPEMPEFLTQKANRNHKQYQSFLAKYRDAVQAHTHLALSKIACMVVAEQVGGSPASCVPLRHHSYKRYQVIEVIHPSRPNNPFICSVYYTQRGQVDWRLSFNGRFDKEFETSGSSYDINHNEHW